MGQVKWTRTTPVVGALGQSKQADSTGEVLNSPVHSPKQAEQADSTGARRSRTAPVVRVGHTEITVRAHRPALVRRIWRRLVGIL